MYRIRIGHSVMRVTGNSANVYLDLAQNDNSNS